MPTAPNLPTSGLTSGVSSGALTNWYTLNGIANSIYLASIGTTRTGAYTLTQANSGELIPVNAAGSVAITVPVLAVGTSVELLRQGAGAVTLTASGTTFLVPAGSTATPRVQGSVMALLWLTTTSVLVSGDLT
jgi:hypothetical protein